MGKLFSPVPRRLPNGQYSTLFDEFVISTSGIPERLKEGMLVLSGDVMLVFNTLQIDIQKSQAYAISFKINVDIGKEHGVFLSSNDQHVEMFLHKQTEERLREMGAVNSNDCVNLDTGSIILGPKIMNDLYSLISTNNKTDKSKFEEFVNENARISFYGDFLYPLAKSATLDDYLKEAPEGKMCDELISCRKKIWNILHKYSMRLLCLSPAKFIHFGTTKELIGLMNEGIDEYSYLGWEKQVGTIGVKDFNISSRNSLVLSGVSLQKNIYLEDSRLSNCSVNENCIISNVDLSNIDVPSNTVLHGLYLKNNKFIIRIYSIEDNPKLTYNNSSFLHTKISDFVNKNSLSKKDLWENEDEDYLWFAKLYPVCSNCKECIDMCNILLKMSSGKATQLEIEKWRKSERMSLYSSFNISDIVKIISWQRQLESEILSKIFIEKLNQKMYYKEALNTFGAKGIDLEIFQTLLKFAKEESFSSKIRIYYALFNYMKENNITFNEMKFENLENLCFETIQTLIFEDSMKAISTIEDYHIEKEEVTNSLPVRVNWGGGWTDTPPYCIELGGTVLNASIKLNGNFPIQVTVKKIPSNYIMFNCAESGDSLKVENVEEIQNCSDPSDLFALHKATLIGCGIVPLKEKISLEKILQKLGGGIYISTNVTGIPKGSGLGTSSILAGACVKSIFELFGKEIPYKKIYEIVLCIEQLMSTGGGWQDQVGGITNGIKFITTEPGIHQKINVDYVNITDETKNELSNRFALIYSGQKRLAKNLLRDVVGNYIGGKPDCVEALKEMELIAKNMLLELEKGNIDNFAKLLTKHWEVSKILDPNCTNTCIEQIFNCVDDLIDGKFIAGAGGGGFLQVILKKGVTKYELNKALYEVFEDSGVGVWESEFVYTNM